MLNVCDAKIRNILDFGIFFYSTYQGAGPARGGAGRVWGLGAAAARGGVRGHVSRGTSLQRAQFQYVTPHRNCLGYCKRNEITPAILCWGHGYAITDVNTWLQM